MARKVRVDFRKMPEYTRKSAFETRQHAQETGSGDDEFEREMSELYGLGGYGDNPDIWEDFGDK